MGWIKPIDNYMHIVCEDVIKLFTYSQNIMHGYQLS